MAKDYKSIAAKIVRSWFLAIRRLERMTLKGQSVHGEGLQIHRSRNKDYSIFK